MLPDLPDLLAVAHVVALPLRTRFRGIDVREALLLRGPEGWTEFAPFVEYADEEAATWLRAALDFGWSPQPEPLRKRIPVNATVPAVAADEVADVLAGYDGCRTAKVKVAERGGSLDQDLARVTAVRDAIGAEGRVRIDANGAWNLDEAERALRTLSPLDLEYAEQPCAGLEELAELRIRCADLAIPIAADESVRRADDPLAVARAGAADLLVLKAAPLGGVGAALRIAAAAELPAVVSSALDTSVGLTMGAHLAAALPELPYDCGLGTAELLAADVTAVPIAPVAGAIPVGRVAPDLDLLERWAAPPERRSWWLDRLRRCHALLPR